ncbi:HET-domain-containing protein [Stipitochalara longipes BDJ]|nr:HET-domain-containing protein [Stipitochalara longipes BDJ]
MENENENEGSLHSEAPETHESVFAEVEIDGIDRKSQTPHPICDMCKTTLTASIYEAADSAESLSRTNHTFRTYWHHKTYRQFLNAVERGCFVCTLLWESIPESFLATLSALPELSDEKSLLMIETSLGEDKDIIENAVLRIAPDIREYLNIPRQVQTLAQIVLRELDDDSDLQTPLLNVGNSTNSQAAWDFVLNSLEHCTNNHTSCSNSAQGHESWYPTRLLDVGVESEYFELVKLIETAKAKPEGPYLTLSHCWGQVSPTKLSKVNLEEFLTRVPALPKTFAEAVSVARKIGARYLWIDSLCIVQDDLEDWRKESSLMYEVYKNALCTIAATASSDSRGGLFYRRTSLVPSAKFRDDFQGRNYELFDHGLCITEIDSAPLQNRAWVLQERLLSPRIIHFGRKQIFWECDELCACETFPAGLPKTTIYLGKARLSSWLKTLVSKPTDENNHTKLLLWNLIVQRYTEMALTFGSDKLQALSGVAKYLHSILGGTYLAGLWKEDILFQLSWWANDVSDQDPRLSEYRAPTWSWASIDGLVHISVSVENDEPKQRPDHSHGDTSIYTTYTKVLDAQTVCISDDKFGSVSDGFLLVEGPLNRISVKPKDVWDRSYLSEPFGVSITFDFLPQCSAEYFILLLYRSRYIPVRSADGKHRHRYIYLVLSARKEQPGHYSRCGMGSKTIDEQIDNGEFSKVVNGQDALCEEYFGPQRGHRIKIL